MVVSAGGGAYGGALMARRRRGPPPRAGRRRASTYRIIAGPFLPEAEWQLLRAAARGRRGLEVRRSVPDLVAELRAAAASVSQCGYNTTLDLLRTGVPALVVPFAEGGEDEQTRRAERLERARRGARAAAAAPTAPALARRDPRACSRSAPSPSSSTSTARADAR